MRHLHLVLNLQNVPIEGHPSRSCIGPSLVNVLFWFEYYKSARLKSERGLVLLNVKLATFAFVLNVGIKLLF